MCDIPRQIGSFLGSLGTVGVVKAIRRFTVRTVLPEPLAPLGELVNNLWWSWHPPCSDLFASIDPRLWERSGEDPLRLLGLVPSARLEELARDADFLGRLQATSQDLHRYLTEERWYQSLGSEAPREIAYFSPEYGLTSVLPQYSGGLGILAGDHLKSASDLGVPITGVGLLYRHGYFSQSLSRDGWQQERYPPLDPNGMPVTLLLESDGTPASIAVGLPGGRTLLAQIWVARVGRVPLLLLDSDIESNAPGDRDVTDRLYGGGTEHRLLQEMLLGIGGVRALRVHSRITGAPAPEVFHTNEGHAGFLGIERIRELTEEDGLSFDEALTVTRSGTVFTTHTPVPAGIDRFPRSLIETHLGGDNASPGVPIERILELGAETYPGGDPTMFNMAVMGLRLSQRANGVSELHGHVSRHMFSGMWPGFDSEEVPIGSITNGVHAPTWVAREALALAEREFGAPLEDGGTSQARNGASDAELWRLRGVLRAQLVKGARDRLRTSWLQRGAVEAELRWIESALDPDVLTIGFARRVPSYKRLTLMLRDPARLKALLLHPERPVQLVVAGKAHPADDGGKRLVQEIVRFSDDPQVRHRIVFLPDYDMALARLMAPGCDVWLNNPLRPLEACGTSGMKVALNGGLNLSICDGWWDEWFDGENGWEIPSADLDDPDRRDDLEASALYEIIETRVAPLFYAGGSDGLPSRWLEMVRHTMETLGPKVLASRMVRDYVTQLYTPAAQSSRRMSGARFTAGRELTTWVRRVRRGWPGVAVEHVEAGTPPQGAELGAFLRLRVVVTLGELSPDDVDVQVLSGAVDQADEISSPRVSSLKVGEDLGQGRYVFDGELSLGVTGPFGYTVRVLPIHADLASSAELGLVAVPAEVPGLVTGDLR
jgi:starch phosphorylase